MPKETPEHRQKRHEELYAQAKVVYAFEQVRFDAAELKAGRFLTVWAIMAGLSAINARDLMVGPTRPIRVYVIVMLVAFWLCHGISLLYITLSMRVQNISLPSAGPPVTSFFRTNTYATVVTKLGDQFFSEAAALRVQVDKKLRLARIGFVWFLVSLGALVFLWAGYIFA